MGFIRGVGIVILSVILFLLLIVSGTALTLGQSLKYENVQPEIINISQEIITENVNIESIIQSTIPAMKSYCQQNNTDYVFNQEGYTFAIPCETIKKSPEEIINYTLNESLSQIVNDIYYEDYNCDFIECFEKEETPLFIVSEKSREYWMSIFYKTLIGIIISTALIILLAEKKSNGFIISGSLFIFSSFIVGKLNTIGEKIANTFLGSVASVVSSAGSKNLISRIVNLFFVESTRIFWWMLVIGIILVGFGIFLKLTNFGMKISKLFNKNVSENEVKGIVKEEVSKVSKQKSAKGKGIK